MTAQFLSGFKNVRALRNYVKKHKVKEREYIIEKIILLSRKDLIYMREHLLEDNNHISSHKKDMFVDDNKVWHVVMYCSISCDTMLLVYSPKHDYAHYIAIKTNGGEQLEKRFASNGRYN